MSLLSEDCIVLQTFPYSETSKILRLLTRSHGVQSALARGALRPRSRYGGVLEPFTEGVATLYVKESRELQTLSGFELARSRQGLGRDLLRFGGALLLTEIILRTGTEAADPELFEAFGAALDGLETSPPRILESSVLAATWALVGRLGFAPSLEECLGCGRELAAGEDAAFDYAAGGVRCETCAHPGAGRALPAHARATLAAFGRGEAAPVERTTAHWALLARYLEHHVMEGGALRSLEFMARALEAG